MLNIIIINELKYSKTMNKKHNIIHFISNHIKIKYSTHIKRNSLCSKIQNNIITINQLLMYLYPENKSTNIAFYLNVLNKQFEQKCIEYLPHLIILYIKHEKHHNIFQRFFLQQCNNKLSFSVLTNWFVNSFLERKNDVHLEQLANSIESTLVNGYVGKRPKHKNKHKINTNNNIIDDSFVQEMLQKENKITYFVKVNEFYGQLKNLSNKLVSYNKESIDGDISRKDIFNIDILEINESIQKQQDIEYTSNHNSIANYYCGMLLPFNESSCSENENNIIILRIIPELSRCIHTKERVPLKIACECIKASDTQYWCLLYKKQPNVISYASFDDFISKFDFSNPNTTNIIDGNIFDSSASRPFGEDWLLLTERFKEQSRFKKFPSYSLQCFIFKANDDLLQEMMIMQLIKQFQSIFQNENIPIRLHPYNIQITSSSSGLIEYIPNSTSISTLKQFQLETNNNTSLAEFFINYFENNLDEARQNFVESLAGYSLITYLLNIKDRHNENILLTNKGEIVHIDFGFVLGMYPGNIEFETAPFKMTDEYIEIMGGEDDFNYIYFLSLFMKGLIAIRKYHGEIENTLRIMSISGLTCFQNNSLKNIINTFEDKLLLWKEDNKLLKSIRALINEAKSSWKTGQYDYYQKITNGILY